MCLAQTAWRMQSRRCWFRDIRQERSPLRASEQTRVASDDAAIERAVGVLEKLLSNQGGIAVSEAIDRLGEISDNALGMVRNETTLRAGVEHLRRSAPKWTGSRCAAKSLRYNRELMQALAARNLLACSRVAAKMALERRESRGLHLRDDYSYIDNENWQVRQLAELVNGEDKLSKKVPVVTRIPLRKAEKDRLRILYSGRRSWYEKIWRKANERKNFFALILPWIRSLITIPFL